MLDHFAWLGAEQQRIDLARSLGVVLLLAGVVLVSRGGVKAFEKGDEKGPASDDRSAADTGARSLDSRSGD